MRNKVLVDTNCLIVYILGLINPSIIDSHRRTSIYDASDFRLIENLIEQPNNLLVLPNIWTEVDNLLNKNLKGNYKYVYVQKIREVIDNNVEKYLSSTIATHSDYFYDLGLTDSLILSIAKECKLLITTDGNLSIRAKANGVNVFDLSENKNEQFRR